MRLKLFIFLFSLPFITFSQVPTYSWGGQIGGTGFDDAQNLSIDIFGNVIVTGFYQDTVDFDFDPLSTNTLTTSENANAYVSKYDPSGNLLWARDIQGNDPDLSAFITASITDASGNIYLTGYYEGTVDLNPDSTTEELHTSNGASDIFIVKLDVNGSFLWGGSIGGTQGDRANAIAIDNQNNFYITGYFEETIDFDITEDVFNLTGSNFGSVFVLKLDENANLSWGKSFLGGSDQGTSIVVDDQYNVYVTGHILGSTDFDPSEETFILSSSGNARAVFVLKLNDNGDFENAGVTHSQDAGDYPTANSIKLDSENNIYIAGAFAGELDFDISAENEFILSAYFSAQDIFVLKLDNDLNIVWVRNMGGTVQYEARAMALDSNDNVYTTGTFMGGFPGDFDPGPPLYPLTAGSGLDVFISVLDSDGIFVDAEAIIGNGNDRGNDIVLDNAGNIYLTGNFTYDIKKYSVFDIDSNGEMDGFLFKFGNEPTTDPANFPPVAVDDSITVGQGCSQILNIDSNDFDVDGVLLNAAVTIIQFPINGSLIDNGDGLLSYVHNGNAELTDSFRYTIADNEGASSNVAIVNVSIILGPGTCVADCNGVMGGTGTTDLCGVCDSNPDNDNTTCTDCEGVVNGDAHAGTLCSDGNNFGIYDTDCNCEIFPVVDIDGHVSGLPECGVRHMTISIYNQEHPELNDVFVTTIDENGHFTTPQFSIGTYSILIKVDGYLAKLYPDETIEVEGIQLEISGLIGGDANNSNNVNISDISFISAAFGSAMGDANYNFLVDLNCDGVVNISDVSLMNVSFGMSGDDPPGE